MEEFLKLEFAQMRPEYIKIIVFIFSLIKCTFLLAITVKLLRLLSNKLVNKIKSKIDSPERIQQLITLKIIIVHALEVFIFGVYIISILFLIGIDVRPLLATAGVLGVAIGFGSKKLVEDVITGVIILLEGQIRVGDYVEIGDIKGIVEKITLPLITVRTIDTGALCFVRCGYINTIVNHTMQYSYSFFAFDVAYESNIEHVFNTIKKSFEILLQNEEYKKLVLSDIEIFGLDEFKESALCVKCRVKTQPKGQWIIRRAFNKIIKEQFEIANIEIPFNQLVVTNKA